MSGLLNSALNGSASSIPDSIGRSFSTSFSVQSGTIQGLHNIHGSFHIPNIPGTLASRNSSVNNVPSGGVQRPSGSLSIGRFTSNNLPIAFAQLSHSSSHGLSGVTNRGGISAVGNPGFSNNTNGIGSSIPGILSTSAGIGNRNAVPGLGVSQILGNASPRITSSVGNMVGAGNIRRTISSGGGVSVTGLASRLNLTVNSGSGSLSIQEQNRLMSGVLPQGTLQKQDLGVSPIVQQNQEFSIQNEDFPALPGFKGGNADYSMDLHQKERLCDDTVSMM